MIIIDSRIIVKIYDLNKRMDFSLPQISGWFGLVCLVKAAIQFQVPLKRRAHQWRDRFRQGNQPRCQIKNSHAFAKQFLLLSLAFGEAKRIWRKIRSFKLSFSRWKLMGSAQGKLKWCPQRIIKSKNLSESRIHFTLGYLSNGGNQNWFTSHRCLHTRT